MQSQTTKTTLDLAIALNVHGVECAYGPAEESIAAMCTAALRVYVPDRPAFMPWRPIGEKHTEIIAAVEQGADRVVDASIFSAQSTFDELIRAIVPNHLRAGPPAVPAVSAATPS